MEIKFHGQSCFELSDGNGTTLLVDPFLKPNNPVAVHTAEEVDATHIAITHGHADHMADAVPVAQRTGAHCVSVVEIAEWLKTRGVEAVSDPDLGGTVSFDWGWIKLVPAWHTSTLPGSEEAPFSAEFGVAVGTAVSFPNRDQIHHHVYSFSRVKSFDLPLSKGTEAAPVLFDTPGVVKVGCNIHDWMMGVILVTPTAAFTTTDDGGAFTLRDVPDGDVTIAAWHEASETPLDDATQRLTPGTSAPELTFTLAVRPEKARPATHGGRGTP